jgi:putative DNA primase/helicase
MSTLASVAEENEAAAWNPFLKLLQGLQQQGTAVLVVHHANKAGGYRGSSKIAVLFDTILKLSVDPDAGAVNGASFILSFEKARRLVAEARSGIAVQFAGGQWSFETTYDAVLSEIVAKVRGGRYQTQSQIAAELGVQPPAISKLKRKAIQAGLITTAEWEAGLQLGRELADDDHEAF